MRCDFWGDRAKQQGMDLFKPPWVGGKCGSSRHLRLTTAPRHMVAWAGPQCVPPRPAGDHPINLCFSLSPPTDSCGCFPWILGRCPQNWGSEAYVSFLSRQTMINPPNSPWKPTPGPQVSKAGSSTVSGAPPWAESLTKMSWSSSLRFMAKRPSILGRTKVLGLANHFR